MRAVVFLLMLMGREATAAYGWDCGGVVDQSGSTLTSPNYPEDYGTDGTCEWIVDSGDEALNVKITLRDFDLDGSDRLLVFNRDDEVVGNFTGFAENLTFSEFEDFPLRQYEIPGGKVSIIFTSDEDVVRRGFRLEVSWPDCPKSSRCEYGLDMVTDSKHCTQCVCKGCGPVECPTFCPFGFETYKKFGQDCEKCFCKPPSCAREGCVAELSSKTDGSSNNDYVCRCPEKRLGEIKFVTEALRFAANFPLPTVNINGQDRLLCATASQVRPLYRGGFTRVFCNQLGVVREDYIYGATSFYDLEPLFGIPNATVENELVFLIDPFCSFVNQSLSLQDYSDCILEDPIPLSECLNHDTFRGVFGPWCSYPDGFFPAGDKQEKQEKEKEGDLGIMATVAVNKEGTLLPEGPLN